MTDRIIAREKSVGLVRKWSVFFLGIIFLWLLDPERFIEFNHALFFNFAGSYLIYSIYVLLLARGILFNIVWYLIYFVELLYISLIIFYSGGMDSVLILFYPLVLIGNSFLRNNLWDFIFAGVIGHLSYAFTLLVYYSSFKFYLDQQFWVQCFSLGLTFALGLVVLRFLQRQEHQIDVLNQVVEQNEHIIDRVAIIDDRTGLYKDSYLESRLREEVSRAVRYGANLCLLILGIDYFQDYNDSQGQPAGAAAIRQLVNILLRLTRDSDICCHLRAGEIALILPHTDLPGGVRLAERIRKEVDGYQFTREEQLPGGLLTISVGVGCCPVNAKQHEELLKVTVNALHMAREAKRDKARPHLSLIVGSQEKAEVKI